MMALRVDGRSTTKKSTTMVACLEVVPVVIAREINPIGWTFSLEKPTNGDPNNLILSSINVHLLKYEPIQDISWSPIVY